MAELTTPSAAGQATIVRNVTMRAQSDRVEGLPGLVKMWQSSACSISPFGDITGRLWLGKAIGLNVGILGQLRPKKQPSTYITYESLNSELMTHMNPNLSWLFMTHDFQDISTNQNHSDPLPILRTSISWAPFVAAASRPQKLGWNLASESVSLALRRTDAMTHMTQCSCFFVRLEVEDWRVRHSARQGAVLLEPTASLYINFEPLSTLMAIPSVSLENLRRGSKATYGYLWCLVRVWDQEIPDFNQLRSVGWAKCTDFARDSPFTSARREG